MGTNIRINTDKFISRMKELADEHGQNQSQAAEYLGMSRRQYGKYVSGEYDGKMDATKYAKPSAEMLMIIAEKYGVSTDYLLGRSDFRSAENDFIGQKTGLSDDAIDLLVSLNKNKTKMPIALQMLETINTVLSDVNSGTDTIQAIGALIGTVTYQNAMTLDEVPDSLSDAWLKTVNLKRLEMCLDVLKAQ